jgi:starvation-inducible outer membrane lipoprotein
MNKLSKYTVLTLAVLSAACTTIPRMALVEAESAKADAKPVAVEPKVEVKAEAKPALAPKTIKTPPSSV